jgi:hypothetical protein
MHVMSLYDGLALKCLYVLDKRSDFLNLLSIVLPLKCRGIDQNLTPTDLCHTVSRVAGAGAGADSANRANCNLKFIYRVCIVDS